jgi:DNA-directed RNA polymerase subunit RPC12/RpoP
VADPDLRPCSSCEPLFKALQAQLLAKETRVHTLEERVTELEGYVFGRHHQSQNPAKKPDAKAGHPGWFRPKPTAIDRTEEAPLSACPNCGSKDLSLCAGVEKHVQEDLVLTEPQVTLYRKQVYWCRRCGKKVRGRGKDELPGRPIGLVAKSIADFLRYKIKVTERDIGTIFKSLLGLSVSEGAIQGFHTQTRRPANLSTGLRIKMLHFELDSTDGCS